MSGHGFGRCAPVRPARDWPALRPAVAVRPVGAKSADAARARPAGLSSTPRARSSRQRATTSATSASAVHALGLGNDEQLQGPWSGTTRRRATGTRCRGPFQHTNRLPGGETDAATLAQRHCASRAHLPPGPPRQSSTPPAVHHGFHRPDTLAIGLRRPQPIRAARAPPIRGGSGAAARGAGRRPITALVALLHSRGTAWCLPCASRTK